MRYKHSFNIALYTILFLVGCVIVGLTGIFPINSDMIFWTICLACVGFVIAFSVKMIENIGERW